MQNQMSHHYGDKNNKVHIIPLKLDNINPYESHRFSSERNIHKNFKLKERGSAASGGNAVIHPGNTSSIAKSSKSIRFPLKDSSITALISQSSLGQLNNMNINLNQLLPVPNTTFTTRNKHHEIAKEFLVNNTQGTLGKQIQKNNFLTNSSLRTLDFTTYKPEKDAASRQSSKQRPKMELGEIKEMKGRKKERTVVDIENKRIVKTMGISTPSVQKIPNYVLYTKIGSQIDHKNKIGMSSRGIYSNMPSEIASYISSNHTILGTFKISPSPKKVKVPHSNFTSTSVSALNISRGMSVLSQLRNLNNRTKDSAIKKKNSIFKLSIEKSQIFGTTMRGSSILLTDKNESNQSILSIASPPPKVCKSTFPPSAKKIKNEFLEMEREKREENEEMANLKKISIFRNFPAIKIFKSWMLYTRRRNFIDKRMSLWQSLFAHPILGEFNSEYQRDINRKAYLILRKCAQFGKSEVVVLKNEIEHKSMNEDPSLWCKFIKTKIETSTGEIKSQFEQLKKTIQKIKSLITEKTASLTSSSQKNVVVQFKKLNPRTRTDISESSFLACSISYDHLLSVLAVIITSQYIFSCEQIMKFCYKTFINTRYPIELYVASGQGSEIKQKPLIKEIVQASKGYLEMIVSEMSTADITGGGNIGKCLLTMSVSQFNKMNAEFLTSFGISLEQMSQNNEKFQKIKEKYEKIIEKSCEYCTMLERNIIEPELLAELQSFLRSFPINEIDDKIEWKNFVYSTKCLKNSMNMRKLNIIIRLKSKINDIIISQSSEIMLSMGQLLQQISMQNSISQFLSINKDSKALLAHRFPSFLAFLVVLEDQYCEEKNTVHNSLISKRNEFMRQLSQCEKKFLSTFSLGMIDSDLRQLECSVMKMKNDIVELMNPTSGKTILSEIERVLDIVCLFFQVDYEPFGKLCDIVKDNKTLRKLFDRCILSLKDSISMNKIYSLCASITELETMKKLYANISDKINGILLNLKQCEALTLDGSNDYDEMKLYEHMCAIVSSAFKLDEDILKDNCNCMGTFLMSTRQEIHQKILKFIKRFLLKIYNININSDNNEDKIIDTLSMNEIEAKIFSQIQSFHKVNLPEKVISKSIHKAFEVVCKESPCTFKGFISFTEALQLNYLRFKSKHFAYRHHPTLKKFIEYEGIEAMALFEKTLDLLLAFGAVANEYLLNKDIISSIVKQYDFDEKTQVNAIYSLLVIYNTLFNDKVLVDVNVYLDNRISEVSSLLKSKNESIQNILDKYPKMYYLSSDDLVKLFQCQTKEELNYFYSKVNNNFQLVLSLCQNNSESFVIEGISSGNEILPLTTEILVEYDDDPGMSPTLNAMSICQQIDKAVKITLEDSLITVLNSFSKVDFIHWAFSSNDQVITCGINLILTNEISQNLIANAEEKKEKKRTKPIAKKSLKTEYESLVKRYMQWLEDISLSSMKTASQDVYKFKSNLPNIVITIINHINIIESLIQNNVSDLESYDWLKFIRHLWDNSKKEVIVECGGWSSYQQSNYIGNRERIILSPQSDKVFLFNASCFREKSASFIKINTGYKGFQEIFREFAGLFWATTINIHIDGFCDFRTVKRIFDVATTCRNWIFFENIDDVTTGKGSGIDAQVYLSKVMQIIQQEIILNEIKQNDNSTKQKMFCLMGCLKIDPSLKKKELHLKSSSRIMSLIKPDLTFYIHCILGYAKMSYKPPSSSNTSNSTTSSKTLGHILTGVFIAIEKAIQVKLPFFYFNFFFFSKLKTFLTRKVFTFMSSSVPMLIPTGELVKLFFEFACMIMKGAMMNEDEIMNILWEGVKGCDVIGKDDLSECVYRQASRNRIKGYLESNGKLYSEELIGVIQNLISMFEENGKIGQTGEGVYKCMPVLTGNGKSSLVSMFVEYYAQCIGKKGIKVREIHEYEITQSITNQSLQQMEVESCDISTSIYVIDILSHYHSIYFPQSLPFTIIKLNSLKDFSYTDITSISLFYIAPVKHKKLVKFFINQIISRLKCVGILINDEYNLSITEFISRLLLGIKEFPEYKHSEYQLYSKVVEINVWMTQLIDYYIARVKKDVTKKTLLCNVVIMSVLGIFSQYGVGSAVYKNVLSEIMFQSKAILKPEMASDFLSLCTMEVEGWGVSMDLGAFSLRREDYSGIKRTWTYSDMNGETLIYHPQYIINDLMFRVWHANNEKVLVIGDACSGKSEYVKYISRELQLTLVIHPISLKSAHNALYIDDVNLNFNHLLFFDYVDVKNTHHDLIIAEYSTSNDNSLTLSPAKLCKYNKIIMRNYPSNILGFYKTIVSQFLNKVNFLPFKPSLLDTEMKKTPGTMLSTVKGNHPTNSLKILLTSLEEECAKENRTSCNMKVFSSLRLFMNIYEQSQPVHLERLKNIFYFSFYFYQNIKTEGNDLLERGYQVLSKMKDDNDMKAGKKVESSLREIISRIIAFSRRNIVLVCDRILLLMIIQQLSEELNIRCNEIIKSKKSNEQDRSSIQVINFNESKRGKYIAYDFNSGGEVKLFHFSSEKDFRSLSSVNSSLFRFKGIFVNLIPNKYLSEDELYEDYCQYYLNKVGSIGTKDITVSDTITDMIMGGIKDYDIKSRAEIVFFNYKLKLCWEKSIKSREVRVLLGKYFDDDKEGMKKSACEESLLACDLEKFSEFLRRISDREYSEEFHKITAADHDLDYYLVEYLSSRQCAMNVLEYISEFTSQTTSTVNVNVNLTKLTVLDLLTWLSHIFHNFHRCCRCAPKISSSELQLSDLLRFEAYKTYHVKDADFLELAILISQYTKHRTLDQNAKNNLSNTLDVLSEAILCDLNSQSKYFIFSLLASNQSLTEKCGFLFKILTHQTITLSSDLISVEMLIRSEISTKSDASSSLDEMINAYHQLPFQLTLFRNSYQLTEVETKLLSEVTNLIKNSLYHYRIITNDLEYINNDDFYSKNFISMYEEKSYLNFKGDYYVNHILEKIYLSINNKFLFALLMTMETMKESLELTSSELEYVIQALKVKFDLSKDNSIRPKKTELTDSEVISQGMSLLNFYRVSLGEHDDGEFSIQFSKGFISILEESLAQVGKVNNLKYYFTSQLATIKKDSERLLYYLAFIEDQSPSFFKYLINKFIRPIYSIDKFKINNLLKRNAKYPISIKADPSINITNFLCSLAAYYEIDFYVIRELNFYQRYNKENEHEYKYIIDDNISRVIIDGIKNGVWLLMSTEIDERRLYSIIEIFEDNIRCLHNNFKIFIDLNLVNFNPQAKKIIEERTQILQVDNNSVEDLEAAHDVWVNVLEENILSESLMDESQKDFLVLGGNANAKNNDISSISINGNNNCPEECSELKGWKLLDSS